MKKIVLALLIVGLSGCAVTPRIYAEAVKQCKENGGVKFVWAGVSTHNATCMNGVTVEWELKR